MSDTCLILMVLCITSEDCCLVAYCSFLDGDVDCDKIFAVEWNWDENEITSAMSDLHHENKVYVLLNCV